MFLNGAKFVRIDGNHEDIDAITKEMVEEVHKVDPKARVHILPSLPTVVRVFCPEEKPKDFGVHVGWLSIPLRWEDYTPGFFYDVGIQPSRGIMVVPSKPWTATYLKNQSSGFLVSLRELDWERATQIVPLDLLLNETIVAFNALKSKKQDSVVISVEPKQSTERLLMAQEEALQRSVMSHQESLRSFEAETQRLQKNMETMKQAVDRNRKTETESSKKMYSLQADVERYKASTEYYRKTAERYKAETERYKAETERYMAQTERYKAETEQVKADAEQFKADAKKYKAIATASKADAERSQKKISEMSHALVTNKRTIATLRNEILTLKKISEASHALFTNKRTIATLREEVKHAEEEKTDTNAIRRLGKEVTQRRRAKTKKSKKKPRLVEHNFDVKRYVKEQENRTYEAEMRLKSMKDLVEEFKVRMKQTKEASNDLCRRAGLAPTKTTLSDIKRVSETIYSTLDKVNQIAGDSLPKKALDDMVKTYRARKGKKPLTILNLHELVATVKWNFLNGAKEYASRVDTLHSMTSAFKQANKCIRMDIAKHVASERFLQCRMDMDTHYLCTNVIEWCRFVEENAPANPREHTTFLDEIVTICCIPIRRVSNVIHGVIRNHVNIVTIQRYVRRWLFGKTNYRHFSMRRHTELVMVGVLKEVITDRPLIEPCIRVSGLIEAGLVSREKAPYLVDETKGMDSPYWKLRLYLQTAVEARMNTFANTIFKTHQNEWPERIVAGVYVPEGDPDKVVEFLYHHGKEDGAATEMAKRWGIDRKEAAHLVTRYLSTVKDIVDPKQSNRLGPLTFNNKWTMSG